MTSSSFLVTLNCEEKDSGLKFDPKEFRDIFSYLTNNSAKFFEEYWEQCPVHFKRSQKETSKIVNQNAFSRRKLLEIVNSNSLPIDTNLSAVKYVKKARESRHFNSDVASGDEIEKAFKEKYTVQFFQPQRFSDELHYINAGFEHIFGSLAGASAYLTPANTQGLAPHHDDVDVFVLQCEGLKAWNLWENSSALPENHSNDIPRSSLPGKGTPVLLSPGDILYMPRGTIHEAVAQNEFSTHVTISVYQHYNKKKLLSLLIPKLLESAFQKNIEFRKGLPLRMNEKLGSFVNIEENYVNVANDKLNILGKDVKAENTDFEFSSWRNNLVLEVKGLVTFLSNEVSLAHLDETADEIYGDFVMHRLPPPDLNLIDNQNETVSPCNSNPKIDVNNNRLKKTGEYNNNTSSVKLKSSSIIRICDPRDMFCMIKEESGVNMIAMAHNRNNSKEAHMGHPPSYIDEGYDEEESGDEGDENGEESNENSEDESMYSDEEEGEGEGFQWSLFLPVRLAPIIIALKHAYYHNSSKKDQSIGDRKSRGGGIKLIELQHLMTEKRIFDDEVIMTITQLRASGFIDDIYQDKVTISTTQDATEVASSPMNKKKKLKKNKNDNDIVNVKREGKEERSTSSQQIIESKLPIDPISKKRKDISKSEVSSNSKSENYTHGHIINSENRFYQEKNKSKRKKLRS